MARKRLLEMILAGEGLGFDPEEIECPEGIYCLAVPVIADEVCQYFYQESDKEYWDEIKDFQNVAPPHNAMWIEFNAPKFIRSRVKGISEWIPELWQKAGCLLIYVDADLHPAKSQWPGARWICSARSVQYLTDRRHDPYDEIGIVGRPFETWEFQFAVGPDGRLLRATFSPSSSYDLPPGSQPETRAWVSSGPSPWVEKNLGLQGELFEAFGHQNLGILRIALLSVFFMHAKGANLKARSVPLALRKAREKRRRPRRGKASTEVTYKVLDIGMPLKTSIREAKAEGSGYEGAVRRHLRRGGFATYREEKPHVSGFVGTMWRSPTVVGSGPGRVEKAYRVKAKEEKKKRKRLKRKRRKKNPGPDVRFRELERRAAQGDQEAAAQIVRERLRQGEDPVQILQEDEHLFRAAVGEDMFYEVAVQEALQEMDAHGISSTIDHGSEYPERDKLLLAELVTGARSPEEVGEDYGLMPYNDGPHGLSLYTLRRSRWVDGVMAMANLLLGGFGVEEILHPLTGELAALYVNMGDTYAATLLYDEDRGDFEFTSWGGFVEEALHEHDLERLEWEDW